MTKKPRLMNTFSIGDIISAAAIIFAGIAVWVTLNVSLAEANTNIEQVDKRVDRLEQRLERQLMAIDNKLEKINEHLRDSK